VAARGRRDGAMNALEAALKRKLAENSPDTADKESKTPSK
jgi:hypothetical protein